MGNVHAFYPDLASHFAGRPDLEFWEDHRTRDIKLRPAPGDLQTQIDAFAYWTVHAGNGIYEEKKSMLGYVVSISPVTIDGQEFFLEFYLHQGYTNQQYWDYSDGIGNAVTAAKAAAL